MPARSDPARTGRGAAARALGRAAARPSALGSGGPETTGLSEGDAALARAVHRVAVQRWITLEWLLDRHLRRPCARLEPALRGVLLTGAAQLIAFADQPAHAVVDEAVEQARRFVRPGARGMVNAVLHRLAEGAPTRAPDAEWRPAADALPGDVGVLRLPLAVLPDPADRPRHLSIACGVPQRLAARWLGHFEPRQAEDIARHGVREPPVLIAGEWHKTPPAGCHPHEASGFAVWGPEAGPLEALLAADPRRRAQDPGSAAPAALTRDLTPARIVDYCAGRGTKTKQLAALHPDAALIALEPDPARRAALADTLQPLASCLFVGAPTETSARADAASADLLVLDVPCSNTGVLGRRPEARHRFGKRQRESLTQLQQQIAREAIPLLAPGGWLLYATCSLEPEENGAQARALAETHNLRLEREQTTLPRGGGTSHRDGGYAALMRRV
jgi:16S rRNA (cytosine967-C5)-methyltransferase